MGWLMTLLIVLQVLSALAVIVLVLLQHGKGADMGAAFGSGASGSLFGATGSANFLSRSTGAMATVFFIVTLALAYSGFRAPGAAGGEGVMGRVPAAAGGPAPATPADVPTPSGTAAPAPAGTTAPAPAGAAAPAPAAVPAAPKSVDIPK